MTLINNINYTDNNNLEIFNEDEKDKLICQLQNEIDLLKKQLYDQTCSGGPIIELDLEKRNIQREEELNIDNNKISLIATGSLSKYDKNLLAFIDQLKRYENVSPERQWRKMVKSVHTLEKNPHYEPFVKSFVEENEQYHFTQTILGMWFLNKLQNDKANKKKAFNYFSLAASASNGPACYWLGWLYEKGIGVNQQPELAFSWYQQAAELGILKSQVKLGRCYQHGMGTKADLKKSFQAYLHAAKQGHISAHVYLGDCYRLGQGTTVNAELAFNCYKKASEVGNAEAIFRLASCYKNGHGVKKKNYHKAITLTKVAAKKGYAEAQRSYGRYYLHKTNRTDRDKEKAFKWLKRASEKGDVLAYRILGSCYKRGIGTPQNLNRAFQCYEIAARNGNVEAMFIVNECHKKGIGTGKSDEKANEWMIKIKENIPNLQ